MKKSKLLVFALILVLISLILPVDALADPSVTIDPSDGVSLLPGFPMYDAEHGAYVNAWTVPGEGTTYTLNYTNSADMKIFVSMGDVQSVNFNDDGTITAVVKSIMLYPPDGGENGFPGLMAAVVNPTDGPPPQSKGMYISTNAYEWEMRPSEMNDEGKPEKFVIKITGKSGVKGWFKWFWPQALLDFVGIDAEKLAGFVDSQQTSTSVEEVPGGALITINLTYSTHTIKTGEALPLSLASSSQKVSRGKKRLYGWVSPKDGGRLVNIYRKVKGARRYRLIGRRRTDSEGFFKLFVERRPEASYKTKTNIGGRVYTSPVKSVN